jgi:lipid-binding SYLF domain-containing protein
MASGEASCDVPAPGELSQCQSTNQPGNQITLRRFASFLAFLTMAFSLSPAWADGYDETIAVFKKAKESGSYFEKSYGYVVFPTIGKGGMVVGGAYGKGRVYEKGRYVGDTSVTQLTAGLQLGGEAYSQIIFFADRSAFDQFTTGNFEFGAQAQAVAITAGASVATTTTGTSASASVSPHDQRNVAAQPYQGMTTFTVAKGGLMYEASIGGQKFNYKKK